MALRLRLIDKDNFFKIYYFFNGILKVLITSYTNKSLILRIIKIYSNKNKSSIAATGRPIFEGPQENPKSLSCPIGEFLLMHSVIFPGCVKGGGGIRVRRTIIF